MPSQSPWGVSGLRQAHWHCHRHRRWCIWSQGCKCAEHARKAPTSVCGWLWSGLRMYASAHVHKYAHLCMHAYVQVCARGERCESLDFFLCVYVCVSVFWWMMFDEWMLVMRLKRRQPQSHWWLTPLMTLHRPTDPQTDQQAHIHSRAVIIMTIMIIMIINKYLSASQKGHTGHRDPQTTRLSSQLWPVKLLSGKQADSHLDPRCYYQTATHLLPSCSVSCSLFSGFLSLSLSFSHSLLSPPLSLSIFPSLPPLVLYRKTFLVFYSAPVEPGAYFQCPKLIANVRTDPSSRSLFPPSTPPSSPLTSSLSGISSEDTWNIFVAILNPGVLCFWRCSPFYSTACVFVEFLGRGSLQPKSLLESTTES